MTLVAGLDVGGAHLKVALVEDGKPIVVEQHLCPLWQGIEKLDSALAEALPSIADAERIGATMTGELSDLFTSRREGVAAIAERLTKALGERVRFWAGERGFGTCDCAIEHHHDVGSTNFLATAAFTGTRHPDSLLIDFGSTTADIIPIRAGKSAATGLTDAVRQANGELVYTGYTRTSVMAVASRAPFKGEWTTLAREHLATMADVRRILGELDPNVDLHATADGRGKSVEESVQRLARMLGREAGDGTVAEWQLTARYIAECQMRSIHDGVLAVLSRHLKLWGGRLIAAGIGADVAHVLALRVGMQPLSFGRMFGVSRDLTNKATYAAPATAVALLLENERA